MILTTFIARLSPMTPPAILAEDIELGKRNRWLYVVDYGDPERLTAESPLNQPRVQEDIPGGNMKLQRWNRSLRKIRLAAIAVCACLASVALAAPPPGIPDGWSDSFAYSNGARLHYYRAVPSPGKPVVVMVHGVTDYGLSWATLAQELQKSFDIYMLDARGHGLSDPFTDSSTGETLIKDVVGFVQTMKLTKPILIGHSMGAATVMRLGAEYPDLPRAVIMLDPLLGPLPAVERPAAEPGTAPPARRPGALVMFGPAEDLVAQNNDPFDELVATCHEQEPKWQLESCQYWAQSKKQYHGPYSATQLQAIRGTMTLGDSLARIAAPALILKADAPREVRAANLKAASVMKNGKLVHVDDAGHNLHHDQPARTMELLAGFLSELQGDNLKP
jgi:pimeloyl-ACP methyl ester carboxylesterase